MLMLVFLFSLFLVVTLLDWTPIFERHLYYEKWTPERHMHPLRLHLLKVLIVDTIERVFQRER